MPLATNDQHAHAMSLLKRQHSRSAGFEPSSYAPIAQAFSELPDGERHKLRVKFDLVYFENLPYTKYPKLCELESRHGVSVGTSYVNENAGKEFIHYIAESKRQELRKTLAIAKFFAQQIQVTLTMKLSLLCALTLTRAMTRFTHVWSNSLLCDHTV